mmetsp:Transcript_27034/g.69294  ORF Transcript_27034/g.69294 Transcript_27034/m.69294 type:complete len:535 (+) Transcript_27034:81-1685(+)
MVATRGPKTHASSGGLRFVVLAAVSLASVRLAADLPLSSGRGPLLFSCAGLPELTSSKSASSWALTSRPLPGAAELCGGYAGGCAGWPRSARLQQILDGDGFAKAVGSNVQVQEAPDVVETSSLAVMSVNLLKNIIGATVLSLAYGTAAFSDSRAAVLPASILTLTLGALCAYTFSLIARLCNRVGADTFRQAWAHAFGQGSSWVVSLANLVMAGAGSLQYVAVLAESGSSLASTAGLPAMLATRSCALLAITGGMLLPLSFLESCSQLKFTSVVGIAGVFYYVTAIAVRYSQGAYAPGGSFYALIEPALRPSFGVVGGSFWSFKALMLMSMLTASYTCHYNAPKFWRELENRTLTRFAILCTLGFGGAALTYVLGLSTSFLTFGGASAGFIFSNYALTDPLFVIARVVVSFVILCTFPLLMVAFRDGALELLPERVSRAPKAKRNVTLALIATLAVLGLLIKDLGMIISVPGAVFGSAIVYIFPAMVLLRLTRPVANEAVPLRLRLERWFNRCLVLFGAGAAILGTGSALGLL